MFGVKYRYIYIILLAVYSVLNIFFTEGYRLFGFSVSPLTLFLVVTGIVIAIWEGNLILQKNYLERLQPRPGKIRYRPLIIFFLISVGWSVILSVVITLLTYNLAPANGQSSWLIFKLVFGFAFRVNLFLNALNAIAYYARQLRQMQLEAERLKKETAEARFEMLRNQINPHFLFNSFNVLNTLVLRNPETASKFIQRLSAVYRYLLFYQEHPVVRLSEELEFIESYVYLLKTRFPNSLEVDIQVDQASRKKFIAPATLQLLIENAIKHNEISERNPLKIKVISNHDSILVSNTRKPKIVSEADSLKIGIKNIQDRYRFISSSQEVVIEENKDHFSVSLPLLEAYEDEGNRNGRRISRPELSEGTD